MHMPVLTCAMVQILIACAVPVWAQCDGPSILGRPVLPAERLAALAATPGFAPRAGGSQVAGPSQEQLTACIQGQQQVMALVGAGRRRLELARQTNDPAAMRAAIDDAQSTLSAVSAQLGSCVQLATASAADLHAGHVMPPAPATGTAGASAVPASTSTANLDITFRTVPSPPRGAAENQFEVTVKDRQGRPIDGADVSVLLYMAAMPAMNMPEMRNEVKLKGAGKGVYTGTGRVLMVGPWTVTVRVEQNGGETGRQQATFTAT